jgi:hypothetical protein
MRLAERLEGFVAPDTTADVPGAVLSAIGSANTIAQVLTRLPLNEALRECTHLLARYDQLTADERSQRAAEIALVRRHCRVLASLTRCARELEAIA